MEAYQIILLIVVIIAAVYLAVVIYVMSHALEFNLKLNKRTEGLFLVCALKKERILEIFSILDKNKIAISDEDRVLLDKYKELSLQKKKEKEVLEAISLTKTVYARMTYYLQQGNLRNERIAAAIDSIKDSNTFYRSSVALYNSEVSGYNYWINIPLIRWVPYLFGLRKRKIIG